MQDIPQDSTESPRSFGNREELPQDEENLASEDEQLDNDLIVVRARKMMFGKGRENILKMLGSSPTPAEGIGKVAAMLVRSLVQAAKEQSREIGEDVALNAGLEISEDLNELAKKNNVFTYDSPEDEQAELEDASLWGVKYYGDEMLANNEITPEMQESAKKQMGEGLRKELNIAKKPIAAGVEQAIGNGGIVNNARGIS